MAEFTKEEMLEIIKIQQTTSTHLESLVGGINGIVERQQRILNNVENGISQRIVTALEKGCFHCRGNVTKIADDVRWLKILLGSVSAVATLAVVILKLTGH